MASFSNRIIERIKNGFPVVYPTSTLPALGCIPEPEALDRLFAIKNRSSSKVVSLGVSDLSQASTLVKVPDIATGLLDAFPPGSLTLILPAIQTLDERLGGDWIAVRVLSHMRARDLIDITGPLTATSANPSGKAALTNCMDAAKQLSLSEDSVIEGDCVGGSPSTLIRWNISDDSSQERDWSLIREGKVSNQEIQTWLMQGI